MKLATHHHIRLGGRIVDYRLIRSKAACKLRVRVGPDGIKVVRPAARNGKQVSDFLTANGSWILDQLDRAERLRGVRRAMQGRVGEILFHGEPTQVHQANAITSYRQRGPFY